MSFPDITLLIVDDEPDLVEVTRYILKKSGFIGKMMEAHSGEDALALAREEAPGAIISDVRMPRMSGLEMLQELSALRIFTPVIFISGYGDKSVVMEAWRLGAFAFLEKPIDSRQLAESLQVALTLGERFNRERFEALSQNPSVTRAKYRRSGRSPGFSPISSE